MKAEIRVFKDGSQHGVMLRIGVQSFQVGYLTDEGEEHARWYADQLKNALQNAGVVVVMKKKVVTRF